MKKPTGRFWIIAAVLLSIAAGFAAGVEWRNISPVLRSRREKVIFAGPHFFTMEGEVYYPFSLFHRRHPGILLCHGLIPGGKNARLYRLLAEDLAGRGYCVFCFDLRGFGDSTKAAHFMVPNDLDFVEDVSAALKYMAEKLPVERERITIMGHSMGGNLAFAVGSHDSRVKNIIAVSSGNFRAPEKYSARVKHIFVEKFSRALGAKLSEPYWDRLEKPLDMFQYLPLDPSKRVCLVLSDGDWPGTTKYNERLFRYLKVDKSLLIISDSNHYYGTEYLTGNRVIDPRPLRELAAQIDAWLKAR